MWLSLLSICIARVLLSHLDHPIIFVLPRPFYEKCCWCLYLYILDMFHTSMLLKPCKFRICQWLWTSLLGYIRIIACHLCFVRSISVWVSSEFYMHLIGWHISIFDDVATFLRREMILWVSCRWYSLVSITNFRRVIKSNVYEIKEWNYILRVLVFHLCFIALYILGNNTATPTNHTQGGLCYVLASQTQPIDTKRKSFRLAGKKNTWQKYYSVRQRSFGKKK